MRDHCFAYRKFCSFFFFLMFVQAILALVQKAAIKPIYHLLIIISCLEDIHWMAHYIITRKYLRSYSSNKSLYLLHYMECHAAVLRGSCNMCWHVSYILKNLYTIADVILFLNCWNYLWRVTALTTEKVSFSPLLKVWKSQNEISVRFESCSRKYLLATFPH